MDTYDSINKDIVACELCPRLIVWCRQVAKEKRKSYADEEYWGRPVPNFGDPAATGLVVGLAPAAHGANRTGRQFTGDRSGDWLYRALHKAGLANQPTAIHAADGLALDRIILTPVCHCAPPDNKPMPEEIENCSVFLRRTLALRQYKAFLCLGNIGWTQLHRQLGVRPVPRFTHGVESVAPGGQPIFASFHPSQQNTFTGRLTEAMLDSVVHKFAEIVLA